MTQLIVRLSEREIYHTYINISYNSKTIRKRNILIYRETNETNDTRRGNKNLNLQRIQRRGYYE